MAADYAPHSADSDDKPNLEVSTAIQESLGTQGTANTVPGTVASATKEPVIGSPRSKNSQEPNSTPAITSRSTVTATSHHLFPVSSSTPKFIADDSSVDAAGSDSPSTTCDPDKGPQLPASLAADSDVSRALSAHGGAGLQRSLPIMSQAQQQAPTAPGAQQPPPATPPTAVSASASASASMPVQRAADEPTTSSEGATSPRDGGGQSSGYGWGIAEGLVPAPSPQFESPVGRGHQQKDGDKPQRPGTGADRDVAVNDTRLATTPGHDRTEAPSDASVPLTEDLPPLHTSSVLPRTKIAHPKPITVPPPTSNTTLQTPHSRPDLNNRSSAFSGNVAQLEATAERLSTGTSSIGDAIRDLHGELKRSDSRRSSILAASLKAQNEDAQSEAYSNPTQLKRHLSNASSIVATNSAARHGGYSPAGFVMSPTHSMSGGRLRSGSKNSSGRPDIETEPFLSRHGPGKASVRSVRSTKMSLAEITESEPTSLTRDALDAADAAPPIEDDDHEHDVTIRPSEQDPAPNATTASFYQMLEGAFRPENGYQQVATQDHDNVQTRPGSSHSVDTFQQAREAFLDFDGVYWDDAPQEPAIPLLQEAAYPTAYLAPADMMRPQSYVDPSSGQRMLYYPAQVPSMINLPPKLSSRPKVEDQRNRRSKVLSAMVDANVESQELQAKRKSGVPEPPMEFLPDTLAGHRGSFEALSHKQWYSGPGEQPPAVQPETEPSNEEATALRRPKRLSRGNHKAKPSRSSLLPPQLRASAFFDLPSSAPDVEAKDGSAMDTLDSMLDASMSAPVGAFTGNAFTGKKEKKHKPKPSTSSLAPDLAEKQPKKKRSSRSWFKRKSNHSDEKSEVQSPAASAPGDIQLEPESQRLAGSDDEHDEHHDDDASESDPGSDEYDLDGQPTTLLAELQQRKHQQKQRTQPKALSSHMTLMQLDAVAATQQKERQMKRVNLAWEDPNAHLDQNGSDDEDIPLAIIAAKHQGAKNMADLERPIGLMERRELEENEPLSHRRARLHGFDPSQVVLPARNSVGNLSTLLGGNAAHVRTPSSLPRSQAITPEPEEPEIEEETLGDRKRRLAARELPHARSVSGSFSAELLSQFGDFDEAKNKENKAPPSPPADEEEETLGQRRLRLQAEKEARDKEMGYSGQAADEPGSLGPRRLSMADMLSSHPKRDNNTIYQRQKADMERAQLVDRENDARMAAFRMQMPANLTGPNVQRTGGFRSGLYNDGMGGNGGPAAQSTASLNTHGLAQMRGHNRSSTAVSAYGMPMGGARAQNFGAHMNNMGALNQVNPAMQSRSSMHLPMQMQMPMQPMPPHLAPPMDMSQGMSAASMKRVDQWRHGIMP